jgi:protein-glutamine gamma-glutamyltransferase
MYDIRQFRPTVYALLALGFTGFAVATIMPLLWILSSGLLLLNYWLVRFDRFRPLPRWAANGLTLIAAGYTAMQIYVDPAKPIFPIGTFLVILQLIKLYEIRGNRDFAQLLVLSVLLMVSAIISTASLLFGVIFIVYVLLSPYAALLFHLKVETDHAKRQMGLDEKHADPLTLRQDQRFLNRSMTRLTAVVAAVALATAVIVFLFFPRVPNTGFLAWQFRPSMAATGMSDQMSMQSVTRVQQNTTEIGSVEVTHGGERVTGGDLYFRGNVYDVYDGDPKSVTRWSWKREGAERSPPMTLFRPDNNEMLSPRTYAESPEADEWVQEFTPLKPTGVSFLLALPGAHHINLSSSQKLVYIASAGIIQLDTPLYRALKYRVTSSGQLGYELPATTPANQLLETVLNGDNAQRGMPGPLLENGSPSRSVIDPRIAAYARKPDVSGMDANQRPLVASLISPRGLPPPATHEIARNIERHLQTQFTYTLDLADNRPKDDVEDPVVHFLYTSKTGWCEHYAYAMTLMCQSLGMNARLVSGYKCDEYNAVGGYFILRQSQAHAWVEVLVRQGNRLVWETFDPTSGIDASSTARANSIWKRVSHVFDYLEHAWANSVVAYDASSQSGMLDTIENRLVNVSIKANSAARDGGNWFTNLTDRVGQAKYSISESVIVTLIVVMTLTAVGITLGYFAQRLRLTRRARRIGLDALEGSEARRLARQLGFYDELTRILERRQIERPPHLTPLEFGQSLSFLPAEAYNTIVRLTYVFYRIRFGNRKLSTGQRRSLARVIERLQHQLGPARTRG